MKTKLPYIVALVIFVIYLVYGGFYVGKNVTYTNIIQTDLIQNGLDAESASIVIDAVHEYLKDAPVNYYLTVAESFQNRVFVLYVKPLEMGHDEARVVLEYDVNTKEVKIVAFGTAFPGLSETYPYLHSI